MSPPSETFSLVVSKCMHTLYHDSCLFLAGQYIVLSHIPTASDTARSGLGGLGAFSWLQSQTMKLSMVVGVVSSNLLLLYFLVVGCCLLCSETMRRPGSPHKQYIIHDSNNGY